MSNKPICNPGRVYFFGIYAPAVLRLFFNSPCLGLKITQPFCFFTPRATQTRFPLPAAWRAGCFLPFPMSPAAQEEPTVARASPTFSLLPVVGEVMLSPNFLADSVPPWSLLGASPQPPQGAGISLLRGQALPLAWGPSGRAVCVCVSLSHRGAQPWRAQAVSSSSPL